MKRASAICCAAFAVLVLASSCERKDSAAADAKSASATTSPYTVLDREALPRFIASGGTAIVDFGGKNCGPCKKMRQNFAAFNAKHPKVKLGLVYWEDVPELFEEWHVGAVPVQIVFDADGKETQRHQGVWDVDEMEAAVFPNE